jgi:hypothetical protein
MADPPAGWSGNFLTVHATACGCYSTVSAAIGAASDGDIILVYGTITDNPASEVWFTGKLFIRGVGTSPEDIVVTNSSGYSFLNTSGQDFLIENMTLHRAYIWRNDVWITGDSNGTVNKCNLTVYNSSTYVISGYGRNNTGLSYIKNCKLSRGYAHLHNLNLANIYLQKTELNNALATYDCANTLAESDTVTTPTENYGYNYGTLEVTDAFLDQYYTFPACSLHMRHNRFQHILVR